MKVVYDQEIDSLKAALQESHYIVIVFVIVIVIVFVIVIVIVIVIVNAGYQ